MASRSAKYYQTHPKARAKKKAYDTKFNSKPEQVKKRVELKKANAEHDKKYGKATAGQEVARSDGTAKERGHTAQMP